MGNFERTNAACLSCYLLSGSLIFVVLSVLSEKTSVPVSGRRDPLNAWRSQYHVWRERERERVGSVKSPNMWRNTQFHMNIKFFSLDVCIICKYWNIWSSVKSEERPVVILSLSLSLSAAHNSDMRDIRVYTKFF